MACGSGLPFAFETETRSRELESNKPLHKRGGDCGGSG